MSFASTLRFISEHPLNRESPIAGMLRFARWQASTRLLPGPRVVPFVDDARLVVRRGMTGATGNVYCGLHEYEHMGFLLHFVRPDELVVDVGANVGSYTVLAAGVVGAEVIAVEPLSESHAMLVDNIRENRLEGRVQALQLGLSDRLGLLRFSADLNATNHVVCNDQHSGRVDEIPVDTLDRVLGGRIPSLLKIDVEGFELPVLRGGEATLSDPGLRALIIELNGSGRRYGHDDTDVDGQLRKYGFDRLRYEPRTRQLRVDEDRGSCDGNALFVRDVAQAMERVRAAPRRHVRATDSWL